MSGKLLMFAKLSLKSFVCEIIETFCFPNEKTKQIFKKYQIEKVEIYYILTDTDSTSLKFIFISRPESDIPESKYRKIIFEVVTSSDIYKRFDSSHPFQEIFDAKKENKRKKLGYYEIENIDNSCILTPAVNPKEYLELFLDKTLNKKHKGIKKGLIGLGFENLSNRITSLVNFDTFKKPPLDTKKVSRLTVVNGEMIRTTVTKNEFSQLNYKRFFFLNGVVSLPFHHTSLVEIVEFKRKK